MKKRLLSLLLALVMVVGMLPTTVLAAQPAAPATVPEGLSVTYTLDGETKTAELLKIGTSRFTYSGMAKLEHDVLLASLPNGAQDVKLTAPTDWNLENYYGKTPNAYGSWRQIQPDDYMEDEDFVDQDNLQTTQYGTYGFGEYISALDEETRSNIPTQNVEGFFASLGYMPSGISYTSCVHVFVQISTGDGTVFTDEMKAGLKTLLDRVADGQTEFYKENDRWNGKTYSKTGFWSALTAEGGLREKAQKRYQNPGSMARYNAIVAELTDAVNALIPTEQANTTALYDALEAAKAVVEPEKIYTEASVKAFTDAKAAAETLLGALFKSETGAATASNTSAKQADVDAKAATLTAAIEGLTADAEKPWDGERYDASWYNTTDKEFTISNYMQLAGLARLANGTAEGVTGAVNFRGKTVKLDADVNLGGKTWTSIGTFAGTFDGQGHTVSALVGSALFNQLDSDGTIKNLTVDGAITTDKSSVAALVNRISANTKLLNCINRATVTGYSSVAGLVASVSGNQWATVKPLISGCANYGAITATNGNAAGLAEQCYYANIYNCYNAGSVTGVSQVAGVAKLDYGDMQNCYNAGAITGASRSAIMPDSAYGSGNYYLAEDGLTGSAGVADEAGVATALSADALKALAPTLGWPFAADDGETQLNGGYPVFEYQKTGVYKDEADGLTLTGVSAKNGTLTCILDRTLSYTTLAAADFAVTVQSGTQAAAPVAVQAVSTNGSKAILTVPQFYSEAQPASYTYTVSFKGAAAKTGELTVPLFSLSDFDVNASSNTTYVYAVAPDGVMVDSAATEDMVFTYTVDDSTDEQTIEDVSFEIYEDGGENCFYCEYPSFGNDVVSHTYHVSIQYKGGSKYTFKYDVDPINIASIDSFENPSKIFGYFAGDSKNATVKLTMSKRPVSTPAAADFSAYYTLSGSDEPHPVTFTSISMRDTTATLKFAPIAAGEDMQTATLYVGYKTGEKLASQPAPIPGSGSNWSDDVQKPAVGDGTQTSPYQIGTAQELAWFAALVNGNLTDGTAKNRSAWAELTADISLNDTKNWETWTAETGGLRVWKPIGNQNIDSSGRGFGYTGTFDGHGHTISGMFIPCRATSNSEYRGYWLGLFGLVEGTVKNVRVERSVIDASSARGVKCGGIAGVMVSGSITNCSTDIRAKASSTNLGQFGGIVGKLEGRQDTTPKIIGCASSSQLTGEGKTWIGGIVGSTSSPMIENIMAITDCYFTGSISGTSQYTASGIANVNIYQTYSQGAYTYYSPAEIRNCYAAGSYQVESGKLYAIANTVGYYDQSQAISTPENSFGNNYYLENADALDTTGAASRTDAELKAADMPAALGKAYAADTKSINGGFPVLAWQNSTAGETERVAAPIFTFTGGGLSWDITVSITSATPGAKIYFTVGGAVPSVENGTLYTEPFTLLADEVRAIAVLDGMQPSLVNGASVTSAMTPTASPATGTYTEATDITLSSATKNATIYYTTDGSAVVTGGGSFENYVLSETAKEYTAPIRISGPCTLQAISVADGKRISGILTEKYSFKWSDEAPAGAGTAEDPYQIAKPAQLAWFAALVNGTLDGMDKNAAACAKLTGDIDMGGYVYTPMEAFSGTFDGDGHTIRNLYFGDENGSTYADKNDPKALTLKNSGTIQNLTFAGADVNLKSGSVAMIAITNEGTISNCKNTVSVYSCSGVAGIAVTNAKTGLIEFCANTGTIGAVNYAQSGSDTQGAAGIAVTNNGAIRDCYNTGLIACAPVLKVYMGQIAGNTTSGSVIQRCYALGGISNWGTRNVNASDWGGWSGKNPYNSSRLGAQAGMLAGGVADASDIPTANATVEDSYFIPRVTLNGDQLKAVSLDNDCFRAVYQPKMSNNNGQISAGFAGRSLIGDDTATRILKTGVAYYAFYDATNETYLALELSGAPASTTTATVDAALAEKQPQVTGKAGNYLDSSSANGYTGTFSIYQVPSNTKTVRFLNTDKIQAYSTEADLTDYRAAKLTSDTEDTVLAQVKQTWPEAYADISIALSYVDTNAQHTEFEGGTVSVIIENTTFTTASQSATGSDEPAWTGTLVNQKVELTDGMTMMQAILAAAKQGDKNGKPVTIIGAETNYISSINGLAEKQGKGKHSGWMGTLDGWFVSSGFGGFSTSDGSLRDGSVIRVMYTNSDNGGSDIGGAIEGDKNTTLKALSFTNAALTPAFSAQTNSYTLTLDDGAEETVITYTAANAVFQARAYLNDLRPNQWGYRSGESMTVKSGDTIYVLVGYTGWSSMQSGAKQTLYTITVSDPATTWTVDFDAQGGSAVAAQKVQKGEAVGKPEDPTREGYRFTGWYLEPECENEWEFSLPVTENMTLYAGWTEKPVDPVENLRNLLSKISDEKNVTADEAAFVEEADAVYGSLDKTQKASVTKAESTKLNAAKKSLAANRKKAAKVSEMIAEKLPATPEALTLSERSAVTKAENAYEKLTDAQKTFLTEEETARLNAFIARRDFLTENEAKIKADEKAAAAAEKKIKALPNVSKIDYTDKEEIEAARAAYEALTNDQKALVTNLETLTAAEDALKAALESVKEQETSAETVIDMINALPETIVHDHDSKEDQKTIAAAREAYDALDKIGRGFVSKDTLKKLTTKEKALKKLVSQDTKDEKAAAKVIAKIEKLPAAEDVIVKNKSAISAARKAYDKLNENAKKYADDNTAAMQKLADCKAALEQAVLDEEAADAAEALIKKLPTAKRVKESDREQVQAAWDAYDALTAKQKTLISDKNVQKLLDCCKALGIETEEIDIEALQELQAERERAAIAIEQFVMAEGDEADEEVSEEVYDEADAE